MGRGKCLQGGGIKHFILAKIYFWILNETLKWKCWMHNSGPRGEGRAKDKFWNHHPIDDVDSTNICIHDTCPQTRLFLISMSTPYQCLIKIHSPLTKIHKYTQSY